MGEEEKFAPYDFFTNGGVEKFTVVENSTFNRASLNNCYSKDCYLGDLSLVSAVDGSAFRMQSVLLGAASPFFYRLLRPHFDLCLEEDVKIIFPDVSKSELENFISYIYGLSEDINESFLFSYISFNQQSQEDEMDVSRHERLDDSVDEYFGTKVITVREQPDYGDLLESSESTLENSSYLKTKDIKKLILERSGRISYSTPATSCQKINTYFAQVCLDEEKLPFIHCRYDKDGSELCHSVFKLPKKEGIAYVTKHLSSHQLIQEEKKDGKVNPQDWDQEHIEQIKCELQVPVQEPSLKSEESGMSKLAVEKLIELNSPRLQYERSLTHSTVWKKFHKILLDNVEIPFVSCITCAKVYVHDRSLGTSSLLRHVCSILPEKKKVQVSLPKNLVQELINIKSPRISRSAMNYRYNKKLKDVTTVFDRVQVDSKDTEFICCKHCAKIFLISRTKTHISLIRKVEMHDCYIKHAPCQSSLRLQNPQDEKELKTILLREPDRIQILERIRQEPHLSYFQLDGRKTDFAHCTQCLKFLPLSSLNFSDERLHRCHKLKSTDHRVVTQGKKTCQCEHCKQTFKSEHYLEIHLRTEHNEGTVTVMCSYCAKEFPTERLAKKHEINIHHPEISKKYKCDFQGCEMAFHDRSKLRLHSVTHSTDQKPYVCEQCGKGFNWVGSFQDHMDMHTGNKKYSCDLCTKMFTKRNTLNNHRRLHTGERPFLCPAPNCGLTFVQRTACKTHARKKHGISITVYTRNPDVPRSAASIAQIESLQALKENQLRQRLSRLEAHDTEETGGRVLVEADPLEHIELVSTQFLHRIQGQTVQITQLPQGQTVQIAQLPQGQTVQIAQLPQGQILHILHQPLTAAQLSQVRTDLEVRCLEKPAVTSHNS